ncbi:MAG: hypothetical protein B0D92_02130 [Spirochaeta sp. LUC14_002_19_P3]|nr:MAG: hypothetical protein B0D92_02130 [Spirochaeta sp. LUC14_002_19_P3]
MTQTTKEWEITADLASLELDAGEAEILAGKAEQMRELFLTMAEADVEGLEPTTHALVEGNHVRADALEIFSHAGELIEAAPEAEDDFFLIPNVL